MEKEKEKSIGAKLLTSCNGRTFYAVSYREKWEDGEDVESGTCRNLHRSRKGAMNLARTLALESQERMVSEIGSARDLAPVVCTRDGYCVRDDSLGIFAEYWIAPVTLADPEGEE